MGYTTSTTTRGVPRFMGRLFQEWRRLRDQAGTLLYLVTLAEKKGCGREAEKIYEAWRTWKISYDEAKKRLEKIVGIKIRD